MLRRKDKVIKKMGMPRIELDTVMRQYLARFFHVNCGGQPLPVPEHRLIRCSLCSYSSAWEGNLGDAVTEAMGGPRRDQQAFRSMVVK